MMMVRALDAAPLKETARALTYCETGSILENVALFRGCLDIVNTLAGTMLQRNVFLDTDVMCLEQELRNLQHVSDVMSIAFGNFQLACRTAEGSA